MGGLTVSLSRVGVASEHVASECSDVAARDSLHTHVLTDGVLVGPSCVGSEPEFYGPIRRSLVYVVRCGSNTMPQQYQNPDGFLWKDREVQVVENACDRLDLASVDQLAACESLYDFAHGAPGRAPPFTQLLTLGLSTEDLECGWYRNGDQDCSNPAQGLNPRRRRGRAELASLFKGKEAGAHDQQPAPIPAGALL